MKWKHAGFNCEIIKHPTLLHWCGYVEIPLEHPAFSEDMYDVKVYVHGGLTYQKFMENGNSRLGFDCAHSWDYVPGLAEMEKRIMKYVSGWMKDAHYWTWEEVRDETNSLAEQLRDYKKNSTNEIKEEQT